MWDELYRRLDISTRRNGEPIAPPTDAQLDTFEHSAGFRLPPSYREFAKLFGPGTLAGVYDIATPGGELSSFELERLNTETQGYLGDDCPAVHERCVYFCDTAGGDCVGWDPESRDAGSGEYDIYARLVDDFSRAPKIASNFPEFILSVCLGKGHPDMYAGDLEQSFQHANRNDKLGAVGPDKDALERVRLVVKLSDQANRAYGKGGLLGGDRPVY
jgi:hypothetical protein